MADGAGTAYWSAARIRGHELAVSGFPVTGLVDSRPLGSPIPESGSSASAFAIGMTTFPEAIGVGPDSTPRRSVLEAAEEAGMATGLVTTTHVVDATPAAFAAHVVTRDSMTTIARHMASSGVDVLLGDGARTFDPDHRPDGRDLLGELARTHTIVRSAEALDRARAEPPERLVGFFGIDSIADPAVRRPSLAAMTTAALRVLDRDPDGFFLLVENEHTDHRGHDNADLETIVAEVMEVDRAVRAALAYRAERPETLIVVAGDHETGGLTLHTGPDGYRARWTTRGHTPELVPIFAIGPGADRFGGILSSAGVGRALFQAIGTELESPGSSPGAH
ncbi:MAG: alkaline phosphatase [Gemmatimonadota bacterium]|nr:alkaline phosphatase [Gemmatimonadota bacterium]